jgi:foldase protein PrsA
MSVDALSSTATPAGATGTKPVVPDPPSYVACIAHLETNAANNPAKGESKSNAPRLRTQCEQQHRSLEQQVLAFLISSQWVLAEAASQGVTVSEQEVNKEYEEIKNQQFPKVAAFRRYLANSGLTVADLMLRVKLSLLASKIQHKRVDTDTTVSGSQIAKYYNENKSRFDVPEKRNVLIILTKTEAAAVRAKREVQAGKSFTGVALKDSIDREANDGGGELTGVVDGEGETALDKPVFAAESGTLNGPVETPSGYYIFEVESVTPSTRQTLGQAQSVIRQQLTAVEQQAALSRFVNEFKKKWIAKTECRAGYVVSDCDGYKG